jgi:hypothetical protein
MGSGYSTHECMAREHVAENNLHGEHRLEKVNSQGYRKVSSTEAVLEGNAARGLKEVANLVSGPGLREKGTAP